MLGVCAALVGAVAALVAAAGAAATRRPGPIFGERTVLGAHAQKDEITSNLFGGPKVERNADVASDGKGTWVTVWHSTEAPGDEIDGTYDIVFTRSTDGGKTWSSKALLAADLPGDARDDLSPTVRTDGKGLWIAAWTSRGKLGSKLGIDSDILYSRSTDDGATWSPPQHLNAKAPDDWGNDFDIRLADDGSGNWIAVWASTETFGGKYGGDSDIFAATSSDDGVTWSIAAPVNSNAGRDVGFDNTPDVGSASDGGWLVVWSSGDSIPGRIGIDRDIQFARSEDGGATWTDPARLNNQANGDEGSDWGPRLATDRKGRWIVVWSSAVNLEGIRGSDRDILYAVSSDDGKTWGPAANLIADSANEAREDTGPVVVTDGSGRWGVIWHSWGGLSYHDGSDADILASFSADDGATWSDPVAMNTASTKDSVDDLFPTIATDGAGNWVSVWQSYFPSTGSVERAQWRMIAAVGITED
jgi:Neuraminidase (sialidase)